MSGEEMFRNVLKLVNYVIIFPHSSAYFFSNKSFKHKTLIGILHSKQSFEYVAVCLNWNIHNKMLGKLKASDLEKYT